MSAAKFDAVLMVGFGGPERQEQIRPFLAHVLKGRPVPPQRIEEVAHHYEVIGGRSPFNALTEKQRSALQLLLAARGLELPVRAGMWHAEPFCHDVLRGLAERGARKIVVVITAAFYDRATVQRYSAVVEEARSALDRPDLTITYIRSPELHPAFCSANAARIRTALADVPEGAKLMFTAHSVPTAVGASSGYVASFEGAAARIAAAIGVTDYRCVYQSRSGGPNDSWLEPDVCAALRAEAGSGTRAVVLAPIGFVCDHVEVLYDLDVEAAALAQALGIQLARAGTVGDHPDYIRALADQILSAEPSP
jgi:ferrochelatase